MSGPGGIVTVNLLVNHPHDDWEDVPDCGRPRLYRFVYPGTEKEIVRQVWPKCGHQRCRQTGLKVWLYNGKHRFTV